MTLKPSASGNSTHHGEKSELHVAVVAAIDGIRFAAVETTPQNLLGRLSCYVREMAPQVLWPPEAERVKSLIAAGELEPAVDHYFACVGNRWDREFLYRGILKDTPGRVPC